MTSASVAGLPPSLAQFSEEQPTYWPSQHAAWRYIRQVGNPFYRQHADPAYEESIRLLDISMDTIPRIGELDRRLDAMGFGAVGVNGFIPSLAFMGFQAKGVMPISIDMRIPAHIEYTPSPDIVHEGFGHISMLASPAYRLVLQRFGELGVRARGAPEDQEYYEAVRHLSLTDENPDAEKGEKQEARFRFAKADDAAHRIGSDVRRLAALYWYTVEYGLVQANGELKIYGAGLISSIGEGMRCLGDQVKKHHLTVETAKARYDITRMQPGLYVADSFERVLDVLGEFEQTMMGGSGSGVEAIQKPAERTHPYQPTPEQQRLEALYQTIRGVREGKEANSQIRNAWENLQTDHPDDWLAPLEILELAVKLGIYPAVQSEIRKHLKRANGNKNLIENGLALISD